MIRILLVITVALTVSCNSAQNVTSIIEMTSVDYANTINAENLKTHLYILADDDMQGRMTGENGNNKAAEYLRNFYIDQRIESPIEENNYYQPIPAEYFGKSTKG